MHAGHSGKMSQMRDMYQFTPLLKSTEDVCSIISAVHALSGCDNNSSFHRIGKQTVCNTITKTAKDLQGLFHYEDRDGFFGQREDFYYCCMARRQNAKHLWMICDTIQPLPQTSLQISCLLLKTHLNNMSYEHSTKFKFGIKDIYQNLKRQVLWAMCGTYQNHESFI